MGSAWLLSRLQGNRPLHVHIHLLEAAEDLGDLVSSYYIPLTSAGVL